MNNKNIIKTRKPFSLIRNFLNTVFSSALTFILTAILSINTAYAAPVAATYSAIPPLSAAASTQTAPLAMLVMSNDEKLFTKAYTDYDDILDESAVALGGPAIAGTDGILEITYNDLFHYYGYFNNKGCYSFSSSDGYFSPTADAAGANNHHCDTTEWSGNFLNWVSMTKMDIIRKVLYGGDRSTDTTTETILERAYIPKDAHAFVKVFKTANDTEMQLYTPFSKTEISLCNVSHASSGSSHGTVGNATPPSIRVADGNWERWSSSEVAQCEWSDDTGANNSLGNLPKSTTAEDELGTFTARVAVCVAGLEEDNCTTYTHSVSGDPTKKPAGMLQKYGIDNKMHFGLISGSYVENNSGGVLRKNISSLQDEIDSDDGTFKDIAGIINTISAFRIISYDTGTKKYTDCSRHSIKVSEFLGSVVNGDQCRNWGNPITEMYLEALRYFSGKSGPSSDFDADDSAIISKANGFDIDLKEVTWGDPLTVATQCAVCSIIVISSGLNSFDMDELTSAGDIDGLSSAADITTKTNLLNTLENITGNYFIGDNGTLSDETCSSKALTNLGAAEGLCTEEPYAQGGFGIAGLSYHALLTDFRNGGGYDKKQTIDTYAIALSRGIPTFTIPTSTSDITIMPSCQANTSKLAVDGDSGWNQCSLVDLQVKNPVYVSKKLVSGKIRIHYEDSHWGNDYDMDGVEDIDFCVGTACSPAISADKLKIVVTSPTAAAGNALRFGYLIGGTTADGVKLPLIRRGGKNFNSLPGSTHTDKTLRDCSQVPVSDVTKCTTIYTAGTSNIKTLKPPLWYAAKWGGFSDVDDNDLPNLSNEWDNINNTTDAYVPDGIPDNYFQADNPAVLVSSVNSIFRKLLNRVASGSAAAVITDSVSTVGAVVQALYQPVDEFNRKKVSWIGQLHAIFIDDLGYLREDTNENKRLDPTDEFILVKYDASAERTLIWYCDPNFNDSLGLSGCGVAPRLKKEIYDLKPIWNANYELAEFSALDARLYNNRDYTTPFLDAGNGGRHILTWQDLNGDNEIDSGEVVPFTAANFTETSGTGDPTKAGLLGIGDSGDATKDLAEIANVVNFIRGLEDPDNTGYRNRTINFEKSLVTPERVWRMGDIVHSSPIAVGPPNGTAYGATLISWEGYGDTSYVKFKNKYKDRRTVVYVGGNDGLIHAFNSGFYFDGTKEYCLDTNCVNNASASHSLGAELWAYAPRNLLPQLKFLTEQDYPHVYYMDGEPRTFDVNLWPASGDTKHPGGWGTILVVGMGLGGGAHAPITVDVDNTATTTFQTGSGYVIFDVTDPEVAPTVLGEFIHPDLGFTTSAPTLLVKRSPDANDNWANAGFGGYPNVFGLVFGSGPNILSTGLSDQNAKLFMLKLELQNGVLDLNNASNQLIVDTGEQKSFIGNPLAKNWNNDFLFDALYFGTSGGNAIVPTGKLMRIALNTNDVNNWAMSTMLSSGQPFLNMPLAMQIPVYDVPVPESWVYVGTGRFLTTDDNLSVEQQSFYGIKEIMDVYPLDYQPLSTEFSIDPSDSNYLQDVTGIKVFKQRDVEVPAGLLGELPGVTDFDILETTMESRAGWRRNFRIFSSAERILARATPLDKFLLFPSYSPNLETCEIEGSSDIYALYNRTGTSYPDAGYQSTTSFFGGDASNPEALPSIYYGIGLVSEITIKRNKDNSYTLVCTVSTGEICNIAAPKKIQCKDGYCDASTGRQSWREILLF